MAKRKVWNPKAKRRLRAMINGDDTANGDEMSDYYALVMTDGSVRRDVYTRTYSLGNPVHSANLVILRDGKNLRRVKDRYSSVRGDVMTESQADWRIVQHVNAQAYGLDIFQHRAGHDDGGLRP
jgi:hypothetical protein